jgi:hypothetical protein
MSDLRFGGANVNGTTTGEGKWDKVYQPDFRQFWLKKIGLHFQHEDQGGIWAVKAVLYAWFKQFRALNWPAFSARFLGGFEPYSGRILAAFLAWTPEYFF